MPFGPFLSQKQKDEINNAYRQNYGPKPEVPSTFSVPGVGVFDMRTGQAMYADSAIPGNPAYVNAGPYSVRPSDGAHLNADGSPKVYLNNGTAPASPTPTPTPTPTPPARPQARLSPTLPEPVGTPGGLSDVETSTTRRPGGSAMPNLQPGDDIKPEDYPAGVTPPTTPLNPETPAPTPTPTETETAGPPGSDTRISPGGVIQTGRSLGFTPPNMAEVERYVGVSVANPFQGATLPTADSGPINLDDPQFDAAQLEDGTYGAPAMVTMNINGQQTAVPFDQIDQYQQNNGANPADQGDTGRQLEVDDQNSGIDWANRTMADNSDTRVASRAAFLDAPDIMSGMKAREAADGLVFASGKYWARNPDYVEGESPALLEVRGSEAGGVNRQAVRDYKAGNVDAQDFFNNYVGAVKEDQPETDTSADRPDDEDEEDIIQA